MLAMQFLFKMYAKDKNKSITLMGNYKIMYYKQKNIFNKK